MKDTSATFWFMVSALIFIGAYVMSIHRDLERIANHLEQVISCIEEPVEQELRFFEDREDTR